jgi:hypothetical protein
MGAPADSLLPGFIRACLRPEVDAGERVEKSENVQKPQNHANHNHGVENRLDGSLHRYEGIHEPEQKTNDNQNHDDLK